MGIGSWEVMMVQQTLVAPLLYNSCLKGTFENSTDCVCACECMCASIDGCIKAVFIPFHRAALYVHHETPVPQQSNICSVSDVPSEIFLESNQRGNGCLRVHFEGVRRDGVTSR